MAVQYRICLINIYGSYILFEIIFKVSYLQIHFNKQCISDEVQKCARVILYGSCRFVKKIVTRVLYELLKPHNIREGVTTFLHIRRREMAKLKARSSLGSNPDIFQKNKKGDIGKGQHTLAR
jgi:hypothetical protein